MKTVSSKSAAYLAHALQQLSHLEILQTLEKMAENNPSQVLEPEDIQVYIFQEICQRNQILIQDSKDEIETSDEISIPVSEFTEDLIEKINNVFNLIAKSGAYNFSENCFEITSEHFNSIEQALSIETSNKISWNHLTLKLNQISHLKIIEIIEKLVADDPAWVLESDDVLIHIINATCQDCHMEMLEDHANLRGTWPLLKDISQKIDEVFWQLAINGAYSYLDDSFSLTVNDIEAIKEYYQAQEQPKRTRAQNIANANLSGQKRKPNKYDNDYDENNNNNSYSASDYMDEDSNSEINDDDNFNDDHQVKRRKSGSKVKSSNDDSIVDQWKQLQEELESLTNKQKLNPTILTSLQARYDLANNFPVITPPKLLARFRVSAEEKKTKYLKYPNDAVKYPMTLKSPLGVFRKNVLPGGLALGQYGTLGSIPLTASPVNSNYTFKRNPNCDTAIKRKEFLDKFFSSAVEEKNWTRAGKILLVLFSHVIKEALLVHCNYTSIMAFLEAELIKLGLPQMPSKVRNAILRLVSKLPHPAHPVINTKFQFNTEPHIPTRQCPKNEKAASKDEPDDVEIIWVKKQKTVAEGEIIDTATDYKIITKNAKIYDEETGALIACFMKNIVDQSDIDIINKCIFATTLSELQTSGSRTSNRDRYEGLNKKNSRCKATCRSASLGILGTIGTNVSLSDFTVKNAYGPVLIRTTGHIIHTLEKKLYEKNVPQEFNYVKETIDPQYIIFPQVKTASVGTYNYDYPTRTHRDRNGFPGKNFGMMTVFKGSKEARYRGGDTIFPEYLIGFRVEEGDGLVANFEEVHCNTKIEYLDTRETLTASQISVPNWHRISLVAFARGTLFTFKSQRMAFQTSDDEPDFDEATIKREIENPSEKKLHKSNFTNYIKEAEKLFGRDKKAKDKRKEKALAALAEQRNAWTKNMS